MSPVPQVPRSAILPWLLAGAVLACGPDGTRQAEIGSDPVPQSDAAAVERRAERRDGPTPAPVDAGSEEVRDAAFAFERPRIELGAVLDAPPATPATAPDASLLDGPLSSPTCEAAAVCEGFEKYAAGSKPAGWTIVQTTGATVSVDDSKHVGGRHALKLTSGSGNGGRAMLSLAGAKIPGEGKTFHLRMMMFLSNSPYVGEGGTDHWDHIRAIGPVGDGRTAEVYVGQLRDKSVIMWKAKPPGECAKYGKAQIPTGRWFCFSWSYDATANQIRWSFDGQENVVTGARGDQCYEGVSAASPWKLPALEQIGIGFANQAPVERPVTVWIDDLAVDTKVIGCP
jgi:hypothetical protein